jgi:hypothetical protein
MHAGEGGRREKADKIIGETECRRREKGEGGRETGEKRRRMQTVLEKEVDGREEKEKGGADWRRRAMEGRGRRETGDKRRGVQTEK